MGTETRRAITLAGGGPACGLHIGALKRFAEAGIDFDVWALSCIGAWVGVIYNQFDPATAPEATEEFFRTKIFRDDRTYSRFPINRVFAPDLVNLSSALLTFIADPRTYKDLYIPGAMLTALRDNLAFMANPQRWTQSEFNLLVLENMAAHPLTRFATSLMYLSEINGLSKIYYPRSAFLDSIDFAALERPEKPFLFHNAYNIDRHQIELFSNKYKVGYQKLTPESLCACSALPYIEETVTMNGHTYCEGALIDTVNFKNLLDDHDDDPNERPFDEIWVIRIVAKEQIRAPRNLTEALGNLCMLFAASVGEDDVKLFKRHAQDRGWPLDRLREVEVSSNVTFEWNERNFAVGVDEGWRAVDAKLAESRRDAASSNGDRGRGDA